MAKVTVVVPAYNAEKYILETLDSLFAQTLKDIEVLVVDDGSIDNTPAIVTEYAKSHSFVRLISQENGGVSSARNHGLQEATGEYILFLDSDDVLTADSLRSFTDALERTNADVAIGRLQSFGAVEEKFNGYADALAKCEKIDKFNKNLLWNFLVGNKCYRLSVLRETGVQFPKIGYSEEGAFFFRFIMSDVVQTITGTMGANMRYRRHDPATEASVSQRVTTKLISDFLSAMAMIEEVAANALRDASEEKKNAYIQEILYKGDYVLLSQFYRLLWQSDEEMLKVIEQGHLHFFERMNNATAEKVLRLNADLPQLYFDFETVAHHPQVSVLVDCGPMGLSETVNSLYMQSMPYFEVFVPQSLYECDAFPERFRNKANLHVLPDKSFKKTAKKQALSKCVLRLSKPCKSDPRVLRFLIKLPVPNLIKEKCFTLLFRLIETVVERKGGVAE